MKNLTEDQKAAFAAFAEPYLSDPTFKTQKDYVQHGSVSTYAHVVRVAHTSYRMALALPIHVELADLVAGSLLHDFYLYDWHDRSTSKPSHATRHPLYAAENAERIFHVSPKVSGIIRSHMWPLPPGRIPRCPEGWILCAADKWCSLVETFSMRSKNQQTPGDDPC